MYVKLYWVSSPCFSSNPLKISLWNQNGKGAMCISYPSIRFLNLWKSFTFCWWFVILRSLISVKIPLISKLQRKIRAELCWRVRRASGNLNLHIKHKEEILREEKRFKVCCFKEFLLSININYASLAKDQGDENIFHNIKLKLSH